MPPVLIQPCANQRAFQKESHLLILLVILLVLSLGGGAWGHSRNWGYAGWSPLGLIVVLLLVLYLTGNLH
jgi:hypothetical protein